jgi:hypothetical protein
VGAFLGNSRCPAEFWIDLGITAEGLHNFLWIILVDNVSRLLLAGSIGVNELVLRCCEAERCGRAGTKHRAAQNSESKGDKFWHKERDLSNRSATPATDFFQKT